MKLIISLGILFLLLLAASSYAAGNIYVDGMGAFTQTTDLKNEFGGGGALLYQVSDDFNFFIKNIFNKRKIEAKTATDEKYYQKYSYYMSTAGIEYLYNIKKIPLFWKNALGIGAGTASIKKDFDKVSSKYLTTKDDTGLCTAVWTGMMYVFTQSISVFVDVGYHKTFYFDELKNAKIMGVQVLVGARLTVWGQNKSIYSEY